jgi:uncharacterized alkaline shock family protein YloU
MSEETASLGRIEVAPEVIATIARLVVTNNETVTKMGNPPSGRLFSRTIKQDGVVVHYENGKLVFDIYVFMDPRGNIREASRALQGAIIEAIDQMVGIPVEAVNIHVEDVTYQPDQAA